MMMMIISSFTNSQLQKNLLCQKNPKSTRSNRIHGCMRYLIPFCATPPDCVQNSNSHPSFRNQTMDVMEDSDDQFVNDNVESDIEVIFEEEGDDDELPASAPQSENRLNLNRHSVPLWAVPPWPEWGDQNLELEYQGQSFANEEETEQFEDPTGHILPDPIKPEKWIRPQALPQQPSFFDWSSSTMDLMKSNIALCEMSDLLRFMICEIAELYDYGRQKNFLLEGGEAYPVPTTSSSRGSWNPINNVFSSSNPEKSEHSGLNSTGKYYIRLYYMGTWRRITVDDQLPVLQDGKLGLPLSGNNEIWPALLIKGLLKIASLSWDYETGTGLTKSRRFNSIAALTGWIPEYFDVGDAIESSKLWNELNDFLPKCESEEKQLENFWTTGKTKKKRELEAMAEKEKVSEIEVPKDIATAWWNYVPLATQDSSIKYRDYSSDSEGEGTHPPQDTSAATTVTSLSELEEGEDPEESEQSEAKTETSDHSTSKGGVNKKSKKRKSEGDIHDLRNPSDGNENSSSKKSIHNKATGKSKVDRKKSSRRKKSSVILHGENSDATKARDRKLKKMEEEVPPGKDDETDPEVDITSGEDSKERMASVKNDDSELKQLSFATHVEIGTVRSVTKRKLPNLQDILAGISHKVKPEDASEIVALESTSGKNLPDGITVILSVFPNTDRGPNIPSFLFHPMNLVGVRAEALPRDPNRPLTPLWKRFRWKAWAMEKGLIPHEKKVDDCRYVKVTTPLALKKDWYAPSAGSLRLEKEADEEEGEHVCGGGGWRSTNSTPPGDGSVESANSENLMKTSKDAMKPAERQLSINRKSLKGEHQPHPSKLNRPSTMIRASHHHLKKPHNSHRSKSFIRSSTADLDEMTGSGEEEEDEEEQEQGSLPSGYNPSTACGVLWFHVDRISPYISKLCKYYSSQPKFGSCYVLNRSLQDREDQLQPDSMVAPTDLPPVSQKEIANYHVPAGSYNLTIPLSSFRILNICRYHLTKTQGVESAFYLFSDSWMDQEILISVDVLQGTDIQEYIKKFDEAKDKDKEELNLDPERIPTTVGVVLEPWNWRTDRCMEKPFVQCLTDSHWSAHVTLRPGRHVFRVWVTEPTHDYPVANPNFQQPPSTYSVKFSAKTPIHVGTRDEVFYYMTNEPVLLLKQSDNLANNIWVSLMLFGMPRNVYSSHLKNLRQSYCPSFAEPNIINKKLKNIHEAFENNFLSMIVDFNGEDVNRKLVLALKCFFLNPSLGNEYLSSLPKVQPTARKSVTILDERDEVEGSEEEEDQNEFEENPLLEIQILAAIVVQKYCRGWLVRRLFQLRRKENRKFPIIEYQIRKIAYLLACQTDSTFSPSLSNGEKPDKVEVEREYELLDKPNSGTGYEETPPDEQEGMDVPMSEKRSFAQRPSTFHVPSANISSVIPNPPKWAVTMLNKLLKEHPLLLTLHKHAYCLPNHVKIREMEGNLLPNDEKCYPFFRRVVTIQDSTDSNWCCCMIQLDLTPPIGAVMRIIDNDTHECLEAQTTHFFLGNLQANKMGYTILAYRMPKEGERHRATGSQHRWKLRIVTSKLQEYLGFKDEEHKHHHHRHTQGEIRPSLPTVNK